MNFERLRVWNTRNFSRELVSIFRRVSKLFRLPTTSKWKFSALDNYFQLACIASRTLECSNTDERWEEAKRCFQNVGWRCSEKRNASKGVFHTRSFALLNQTKGNPKLKKITKKTMVFSLGKKKAIFTNVSSINNSKIFSDSQTWKRSESESTNEWLQSSRDFIS